MSVLDVDYAYSSLSVRDLLDARDAYQFHLLHKPNVIGTAIGRYLVRKEEAWPQNNTEDRKALKKSYPRTLFNSEVRDYSWPCILVFVKQWVEEDKFGFGSRQPYKPTDMVPKTLYMADGRAVPVCVVLTPEVPADTTTRRPVAWPAGKFGGGVPISVTVQGDEHVATAGCLVTDGHLVYAVTARHAAGEEGTEVSAISKAGAQPIGWSSDRQLTRLPFSEVYTSYPGRRSFTTFDVGLVELDRVSDWTSNTYGLPPLGPMADLSEQNLSLRLIDHPVLGMGAASGLLSGKIKALFYRYRSVGGYDYIGDYLIGPEGGNMTRHGDSGMTWHLDVTDEKPDAPPVPLKDRDIRPLAIEWGGQVFTDGTTKASFAVATSLSNICRLLNVELITDLDRGVSGYWGRTGHYGTASVAISLIGDKRLASFMERNLELLTFEAETIAQKDFDKSVGKLAKENKFVPLADVPDEIWKHLPFGKQKREGGRDSWNPEEQRITGPEHPNHYADIDMPVAPGGETFRAYCLKDPAKRITPAAWLKFYRDSADAVQTTDPDAAEDLRNPLHQGLLPFRIWQFYDLMVDRLKHKDAVGFLTAAGTMAHYVGDASQPLHGSIYADGDPTRTVVRHHPRTGEDEVVRYGEGVHSAYETNMVAFKAKAIFDGLDARLSGHKHGLTLAKSGAEVAREVVRAMDRVANILPPLEIVECFEDLGGRPNQTTYNAMWDQFGERTVDVIAEGAKLLALIWESAWVTAGKTATAKIKLETLDEDDVRDRYIDTKFAPSVTIDKIGALLK